MSEKHTKGPWRYVHATGYCGELIAQNGTTIAEFIVEPSLDNARLIAAAPELLAALKRIEMASNATVCNTKWVAEHAKAAIAKVEGCAA